MGARMMFRFLCSTAMLFSKTQSPLMDPWWIMWAGHCAITFISHLLRGAQGLTSIASFPEVWLVTQDKWEAMIHKYSPTNACAIQSALTDAKACTDKKSFNAFRIKRAQTGLGVCGQ